MKLSTEGLNPTVKEVLVEAPALISLLAANSEHKERAKAVATKLFHTETFAGPADLREKLKRVEPFFEETFNNLDKSLPKDPKSRTAAIHQRLKDITRQEVEMTGVEISHWKEMLTKFGMYVARADDNILERLFAPLSEMLLKEDDVTKWKTLLNFKVKQG